MFLCLLGDVLDERDKLQCSELGSTLSLKTFKRFRMTREQVEDLVQNIVPQIEAQSLRASALSVQDKVFMTLRYLASCAIYTVIALLCLSNTCGKVRNASG